MTFYFPEPSMDKPRTKKDYKDRIFFENIKLNGWEREHTHFKINFICSPEGSYYKYENRSICSINVFFLCFLCAYQHSCQSNPNFNIIGLENVIQNVFICHVSYIWYWDEKKIASSLFIFQKWILKGQKSTVFFVMMSIRP